MSLRIPMLALIALLLAPAAAAGEPTTLWSVPVAGGAPIEVGTFEHPSISNSTPSYSPDSRSVAVVDGTGNVLVIATDGSKQTRTLAGDASTDDTEAVWSPDGRTIAYIGERGAVIGIAPAGGARRTLVPAAFKATDVRWSPNGRLLLFQADAKQSCKSSRGRTVTRRTQALFTVASSGGAAKQVTSPDACVLSRATHDLSGEWLPDGKRFVFARETDNEPRGGKILNSGVLSGPSAGPPSRA